MELLEVVKVDQRGADLVSVEVVQQQGMMMAATKASTWWKVDVQDEDEEDEKPHWGRCKRFQKSSSSGALGIGEPCRRTSLDGVPEPGKEHQRESQRKISPVELGDC